MKKFTFFVLFNIAFYHAAKAQLPINYYNEKTQTPKSVLKSSPFPILWGQIPFTAEYRLIYETAVNASQSFFVGASYNGASPLDRPIMENDTNLIKIMQYTP